MGDGDDGARVVPQEVLQPFHGLRIEVVGRLVEEEQVGVLEEQPAEGHAASLATR